MKSYFKSLKSPRRGTYYENNTLTSKRVWVHTNRHNRKEGRNGMIGIYAANSKDNRSSNIIGYTNEIYLSNATMSVLPNGHVRYKQTGVRSPHAGISGTVIKRENVSGELITYDPSIGYFFLLSEIGLNTPRKISSAEKICMIATKDGNWVVTAKNVVF